MTTRKHHGECSFCFKHAFLRPVLFFPGMWFVCSADLCLWCRVDWRDSPYGTLLTTFAHHIRRDVREDLATAPRWDGPWQ